MGKRIELLCDPSLIYHSQEMSAVAKPQLRGLLRSKVKRDFIIAFGISAVCSVAYKFAVNDPRKAKYAEFYKTYDAQADFERMKKAGVFQSVTPDGTIKGQ